MFRTENISVKAGIKYLVKDINAKFDTGQVTAIVGPNGAGKSTYLKCLAGIHKGEGRVLFGNQELSQISSEDLAGVRGYMGQEIPSSFNYTVQEVVLMGRYPFFELSPSKKDISIVAEVLKEVGLEDKMNRSIQSLSGGEKQRVHFARVMAQLYRADDKSIASKLLLLDEPANNLDPKYQHELLSAAKRKALEENIAVVTVLHDLNLVSQYADQVLMFKNGRLMRSGPTEEIIHEEYLSALYEVPTRVIDFEGELIIQMGVQPKKQQNKRIQTLINT